LRVGEERRQPFLRKGREGSKSPGGRSKSLSRFRSGFPVVASRRGTATAVSTERPGGLEIARRTFEIAIALPLRIPRCCESERNGDSRFYDSRRKAARNSRFPSVPAKVEGRLSISPAPFS